MTLLSSARHAQPDTAMKERERKVPSFRFIRGNATKLLSLPLYALGAIAGRFVTRDERLWVFGCGSGLGEGALELYRHARAANPRLRLVWLARDERERTSAQSLGMTSVLRHGWRGFRTTLRAGVIVMTHGLGDANRFGIRGGFIVQLWHGIPFKKVQLDSPVTFRSRFIPSALLRYLYRKNVSAIRMMSAASPVSAARLRTAFNLAEGVIAITGDPRDDVIVRGREPARKLLAEKLGGQPNDHFDRARILLYAPTWRDGDTDPGIPSEAQWSELAGWLEASNSILILRPHPLGVGDYLAGPQASQRIRMLAAAKQNDINPVLAAIDVLITDYSSIAYDFSLTGRPIVFLAPDLKAYAAKRGLYETFEEFSGGSAVDAWEGVLEILGDPAKLDELARHSTRLATTHHSFHDGQNTARVYDEILSRLERQA